MFSGLSGLDDSLLPQKPSLRSRHECSGDSGTNEQKNPEMCLKSQFSTYPQFQVESQINSAHHGARLGNFETFKVCVFQPKTPGSQVETNPTKGASSPV